MKQIVTVDKNNIIDFTTSGTVLVAQLRNSRSKCKKLAVLELLQILYEFDPLFLKNGPFGDVKGCIAFWLRIDSKTQYDILKNRLASAGYTNLFYILEFSDREQTETVIKSINPQIWKGKKFLVHKFFEQDSALYTSQSADKRAFLLRCEDGIIREILGYRGNGSEMGKRGLPVEDCRLLFNLVCNIESEHFVDPFAGGGGIVYQAKYIMPNIKVSSSDNAPELEFGIKDYGSSHFVGRASEFIPSSKFDALATEVPFSKTATVEICDSIHHLCEYMTHNCRIAIMCAPYQAEQIKNSFLDAKCYVGETFSVDRKGTEVVIILAFRDKDDYTTFCQLWELLKIVY